MIDSLKFTFINLLKKLDINTHRYLYQSFNISNRLTGLIGPRGVGKTTLMLQYIKEKIDDINKVFYVTLDHMYFNNNSLFDFVQKLYQEEEKRIFFLDETHKYKNWNHELKNIYDSFPDVKVVFSGSSSLDLIKGSYDLTRRGVMYYLQGLSFREYMNFVTERKLPVITLENLLSDYDNISMELSQIDNIKGHFKDYMTNGYYPFIFEGRQFYYQKLMNIIEKTVFIDISNFYNLKTEHLILFKKILYFLATIPPGRINIHNLSKNLKVDDRTVLNYVNILKETGLVNLIFSEKKGTSLLRNPEKIFIQNSSMYNAIAYSIGQEINIGTLRELFFVNSMRNSEHNIFYSKKHGDFSWNNYNFEIGGKGKTRRQISKDLDNSFLVLDDILVSSKRIIPLYLFGFLY